MGPVEDTFRSQVHHHRARLERRIKQLNRLLAASAALVLVALSPGTVAFVVVLVAEMVYRLARRRVRTAELSDWVRAARVVIETKGAHYTRRCVGTITFHGEDPLPCEFTNCFYLAPEVGYAEECLVGRSGAGTMACYLSRRRGVWFARQMKA